MEKQELLSMLITFVVGFLAGMFLYINVFPTMLQQDDVGTLAEQGEFEIISQAYGGCRSDCPAFRVAADGTFRFQFTERAGEEPMIRSGTLPRRLQREISREVTVAAIALQTSEVPPQNCASASGGIDIRYDVTLGGATYRLDSCRTDVDFTSDAWVTLGAIWEYLNNLSG